MFVHRGDITKLSVECIVNASNATGLGCFIPNHPCIDNVIHKAAGPRLLEECKSFNGIPTGVAKISLGYNLPAKYIIHVTGPIASNLEDHIMLSQCYIACLNLAKQYSIKELAFCCISTGMYGYDKVRACNTAIKSVSEWKDSNEDYDIDVVFVVFTDEDEKAYKNYQS